MQLVAGRNGMYQGNDKWQKDLVSQLSNTVAFGFRKFYKRHTSPNGLSRSTNSSTTPTESVTIYKTPRETFPLADLGVIQIEVALG